MTGRIAASLFAAFCVFGCVNAPEAGSARACAATMLSVLPLEMAGRVPLVRARIDDTDATLVLDTGADRLLLTEAAAARLNVPTDRRRTGLSRGINGAATSYAASVGRLILGTVDLGQRDADVVAFRWPRGRATPDGFLAGSILYIFDLDLDIPRRRATLYRPRDCPDGAPPWTMAFTTLAAEPTLAGHAHLAIRVTLDGQDFVATIDSGAEISVVSREAAGRLGIADAALERDPPIDAYGFGPDAATARAHRFGQLRVAGEAIPRPVMAVTALPAGAGDMLLGEDWLRTHRVWLSFASRRVYIATNPTQ